MLKRAVAKTGIDARDKVGNMLLHTEESTDRPAVSKLTARAFADQAPGGKPGEVALLEQLYACDEYIPEFSVVAVDPDFQGRGIGGHC